MAQKGRCSSRTPCWSMLPNLIRAQPRGKGGWRRARVRSIGEWYWGAQMGLWF
ncbi:Protein of unknown function [Pyronema omphalodes CBS 100304]|uniref:Uncharacterized protein n=1 Tax=Pyronema omphalodes (strain CBS 100304) TaxID=1076935 RepID=U4LWD6_PYROM|nr:Protein of unknown function [Pyronema omphalodes CBS 100304]